MCQPAGTRALLPPPQLGAPGGGDGEAAKALCAEIAMLRSRRLLRTLGLVQDLADLLVALAEVGSFLAFFHGWKGLSSRGKRRRGSPAACMQQRGVHQPLSGEGHAYAGMQEGSLPLPTSPLPPPRSPCPLPRAAHLPLACRCGQPSAAC